LHKQAREQQETREQEELKSLAKPPSSLNSSLSSSQTSRISRNSTSSLTPPAAAISPGRQVSASKSKLRSSMSAIPSPGKMIARRARVITYGENSPAASSKTDVAGKKEWSPLDGVPVLLASDAKVQALLAEQQVRITVLYRFLVLPASSP